MATYNGARYVGLQISSILPQLSPDDELIICDDCSTDATVEIIRGFGDPRIRLEINPQRLGHVGNFMRSLALSRNRYVFLSDQDDIWLPHKVERMVQVFKSDPSVTLVISAAELIDGEGRMLQACERSLGAARKSKLGCLYQLLVKGWFCGCACAVRRDTLRFVLPFPADVFAHDLYLGVAHTLRGRIYWLDEPLIRHRRHEHNLTPRHSASLAEKLQRRRILLGHVVSLLREKHPPFNRAS